MGARKKVGVLLSGGGTNLQALIDAAAPESFPAEIALVLSNNEDAFGLERARRAGTPCPIMPRAQTRVNLWADRRVDGGAGRVMR